MKNRVVKITTKVAAAMAMASVVVGGACMVAKAADPNAENYTATAPAVFRVETESEYAKTIAQEQDDTVIRGQDVPAQAPARTSEGEVVLPNTTESTPEVKENKEEPPKPVIENVDGCRTYTTRWKKVSNEEFERGEYDRVLNYAYTADQYEIQEGKYYRLQMNVAKSMWNSLAMIYKRKIESDTLVKVLRVYEDPRWYGSERTIEYVDLATGKIGKATPNATMWKFGKRPLFYEIFSVEKMVERRRGLSW